MDSSKSSGLFSSLSLGRSSRSSKPPTTFEPVTHPLLGSSTSLNQTPDNGPETAGPSRPSNSHSHSGSWSSRNGGNEVPVGNLPYKPRQRHGAGPGSASSTISMFGTGDKASPILAPVTGLATSTSNLPTSASSSSTSPVNPTIGVSAPPLTSTSTSTTFAMSTESYPPPSFSTHLDTPSTTGASSSSSLGGTGSLTSRLQLQSLKAAAQRAGLGNGTMGMGMIDAIFDKGQLGRVKPGEGGDWGDVLRVLMGGKAIILLPTTPSSSLPMTPQTLRDHIAFLSPPISLPASTLVGIEPDEKNLWNEKEIAVGASGSIAVVVTLSGLVGTLSGTTVTFESTIPPDSPLLSALRDTNLRSTALSSLRPTHIPWPTSTPTFPFYSLSADSAILAFPPPGKGSTATEVSGNKDSREKDREPSGRIGRMNPFASLFGGTSPALGSSPTAAPVPQVPSPSKSERSGRGVDGISSPDRPLSSAPSSPKPSFSSVDRLDGSSDMTSNSSLEGFQVTAYTVSKPVRYTEVHKVIGKALRAHVRTELSGLPEKVIERVTKLLVGALCPAGLGSTAGHDLSKSHQTISSDDLLLDLNFADPIAAGEKLQDLMEEIYDELVSYYRSAESGSGGEGTKRKVSTTVTWGKGAAPMSASEHEDAEVKKERLQKEQRKKEEFVEKEASEGTERVEGLVCKLLYNRIFSPLSSDDAKHDEALASRIAALNMLDLSLDHLGLITRPEGEVAGSQGTIAERLGVIIDNIGRELQNLSKLSCLKPKEKADVLVKAHKIVVDGLAQLPAIRLRPEGEQYRPSQASLTEPSSESGLNLSRSSSARSAEDSEPTSIKSPISQAESDPLTTIAEGNEAITPVAIPPASLTDVPELVLPESDSSLIQEAMADSVMTITQIPLAREKSTSSEESVAESQGKVSASQPTTSGADLILPIIIFAVVKSNPPQLASQLMYLRRYRSAICLTGEASYAIVNLTAVVEFLEHVDLAELGLGDDSGKVMSVDDLSPIGLTYMDDNADAASIASASSRLRGRVNQVSELAGSAAGSANKVLTGVVDSSWTALRGLITPTPGQSDHPEDPTAPLSGGAQSPSARPGMRPRQASTFSLASVTASVANIAAAAAASTAAARTRSRASSRASEQAQVNWGGNQEMIEVSSRPGSVREPGGRGIYGSDEEDEDDSEDDGGHGDEGEEDEVYDGNQRRKSDVRSIRSVSSMMSRDGGSGAKREEIPKTERVSLSNRLASIGVLGRLSNPAESAGSTPPPFTGSPTSIETSSPVSVPMSVPSKSGGFLSSLASNARSASHGRRSSLLAGSQSDPASRLKGETHPSPSNSINSLPPAPPEPVEPAMERFLTCEVADLRLSEIGVLLRDYRRLAGIVAKQQH